MRDGSKSTKFDKLYYFHPVQRSWVGASKKQCDELLEFIRHLAEDDKEGVMATKVCVCVCVW